MYTVILGWIVQEIEALHPGSKVIIDLVLPYLQNQDNVAAILLRVINDYKAGENFVQILVDVVRNLPNLPLNVVTQLDAMRPA